MLPSQTKMVEVKFEILPKCLEKKQFLRSVRFPSLLYVSEFNI